MSSAVTDIHFQAVLSGFEGVVGALDERAAATVADAGLFRRREELVERDAAVLAGEAGGETLEEQVLGRFEENDGGTIPDIDGVLEAGGILFEALKQFK